MPSSTHWGSASPTPPPRTTPRPPPPQRTIPRTPPPQLTIPRTPPPQLTYPTARVTRPRRVAGPQPAETAGGRPRALLRLAEEAVELADGVRQRGERPERIRPRLVDPGADVGIAEMIEHEGQLRRRGRGGNGRAKLRAGRDHVVHEPGVGHRGQP